MRQLILLAGIVFSMVIISCSNDDEFASSILDKEIVGAWKQETTTNSGNQTSYLFFQRNGTYIVIDVDEKRIDFGTWEIVGKKLMTELPDGKNEAEYKLEEGKLYLTSDKAGNHQTQVALHVSEDALSDFLTREYVENFVKGKDEVDIDELKVDFSDYRNYKISQPCPDNRHPHAIDMGEAGIWACCNVGAYTPLESGNYYAWGEVETKDQYTYENYIYFDKSSYHDIEDYLKCYESIGDDISGTQYDVAHVKWGGSWEMPSLSQIQSLLEHCNVRLGSVIMTNENIFVFVNTNWGYRNNYFRLNDEFYHIDCYKHVLINGKVYDRSDFKIDYKDDLDSLYLKNNFIYKVVNKEFDVNGIDHLLNKGVNGILDQDMSTNGMIIESNNGKSIFLPANGARRFDTYNLGIEGNYWSSTQDTQSADASHILHFTSQPIMFSYYGCSEAYREYGRSVRPVLKK